MSNFRCSSFFSGVRRSRNLPPLLGNILGSAKLQRPRIRKVVCRVLMPLDDPIFDGTTIDSEFAPEASFPISTGLNLAIFGHVFEPFPNSDVERDLAYLSRLRERSNGTRATDFDVRRLDATMDVAQKLSEIYAVTFSFYPEPLDPKSILRILQTHIPYAVFKDDKIVSVLMGQIHDFDGILAVELIYASTNPSFQGQGMLVALANAIKEEAYGVYDNPTIFAETITGPVMASCMDFGMEHRGILRDHIEIGIDDVKFHNLHVWSL